MNTRKKVDLTNYTNESLKSFKQISILSPEDLIYTDKMITVLNFLRAKHENPKLTKQELCDLIGVSNSSLKRIMKDLGIGSFYRHKVRVNAPKKITNPIEYIVRKIQRENIKNIYEKRQKIFGIIGKDINKQVISITPTLLRDYLKLHNHRIEEVKNILDVDIEEKVEKSISSVPKDKQFRRSTSETLTKRITPEDTQKLLQGKT